MVQKQRDRRAATFAEREATDRRAAFRRGLGIGIAASTVLAAIIGTVLVLTTGPDGTQQRVEELRRAEATRDAAQIEELTETARLVADDLLPVVESMTQVLPAEGPPVAVQLDAAPLGTWSNTVAGASARFAAPPSGSTGTNVARSALRTAVDLLGESVDLLELSRDLPEERRVAVVARAQTQRDLAMRTWSIGATQLDAINIDAGNGHQHVFLPAFGDGVMTADPAAEGSGAHDQ